MIWRLVLPCLLISAVSFTFGQSERIECGRRKLRTVYLIRNGNNATVGHWPWHAAIYHRKGKEEAYACGGSILDHDTILTAAHCVSGVNGVMQRRLISVQLGRTELTESQDYIQSHEVREIIVHPKFSQSSIAHDIALIKLSANITMSKYVQPVCVWNLAEQDTIVGRDGTIVGFGLTEDDRVSNHLKNALVSVVDPFECIESDRGVFGTVLTSEMICGKGQHGVSACNGDSGGGMFFEISGKWFVRGLVSFTPGRENNTQLCDGFKSTVFTDVAKYMEWITRYIDPRVLHDESDVIVDYDEKLKLFDFKTCGTVRYDSSFYGTLKKQSLFENDKICFATVISAWYAVGPAQCFPNRGVRHEVAFPWETKQIQRVIIHPKFDSTTYANDIALIELLTPTDMEDSDIIPICLPVTPEMRLKTFDHLFLTDKDENIAVSYLNSTDCEAKYSFARSIQLDNQFCVETSDAQDGVGSKHEGAPLFQKRTRGEIEQFFLQGVQTLGYSASASRAFVINDINPYMDWILYNMRFNDLEEDETFQSSAEFDRESRHLQPETVSLFSASNCGKYETTLSKSHRSATFPWIGWLHTRRGVTIADLNNDAVATLINTRFALAAAVVMQRTPEWRFLTFGALGSYYTCQTDDCEDFIQEVEIREVTIHPNYTQTHRHQNDIALIELWPEIDFDHRYISRICLPWSEHLPRNKPLRLTVSTITYFWFHEKQLQRVNSTNCQQRFRANGYHVEEKDISICTIYADGQEPAAIVPGAPLQAEIDFNGDRLYFLTGLHYGIISSETTVGERNQNTFYIPLLFTDINPSFTWIVKQVNSVYAENPIVITNATTEGLSQSDQVRLQPIRNMSNRRLFNFETCGTNNHKIHRENDSEPQYVGTVPWFGLIHPANTVSKTHKCAVILISDWYGISTASCAKHFTGEVVFSTNGSVHRFPVQNVIIHHRYRPDNVNNNIALIQLAKAAHSITPICLPIMNELRALGYKRSRLSTYVSNKRYMIKSNHMNRLLSEPVYDRYASFIHCQIYWNASRPKVERNHIQPFDLKTTICIHSVSYSTDYGTETEVEGSPMFSVHEANGTERHFLRGISLKSGAMVRRASLFHLEIDSFLDWLLENMNGTQHSNPLPFDLKETLIFN